MQTEQGLSEESEMRGASFDVRPEHKRPEVDVSAAYLCVESIEGVIMRIEIGRETEVMAQH